MPELAESKVDAAVVETPPYSRPLHAQAAGAAGKKEDAYVEFGAKSRLRAARGDLGAIRARL